MRVNIMKDVSCLEKTKICDIIKNFSDDEENEMGESIRCKICFLYKNPIDSTCDLIAPCGCKGSIKYVHKTCLRLWRFKGKQLKEIKKCEQCCCNYKLDEEHAPNIFLIRFTALFIMCSIFFVANFIINSFTDAIAFIAEDSFYSEGEKLYFYVPQASKEFKDFKFFRNREPIKFGYVGTTIITIIAYQLFFKLKFLPVFNYFFTLWRIFQFGFKIDNVLITIMSLYYLKSIYNDIYNHSDNIYIFLLNYRID